MVMMVMGIGFLVLILGLWGIGYPRILFFPRLAKRKIAALIAIMGGALFIVGAVMSSPNAPASQTTPAESVSARSVSAPIKPTSQKRSAQERFPSPKNPGAFDDWITKTINQELGPTTNLNTPRVMSVTTNVTSSSSRTINIVADDNFTHNMIRGGILINATEVFHALFRNPNSTSFALVFWRAQTDAYGNASLAPIIIINMTRTTAKMINWDDFLYDNLPSVADSFYEQPNWK